MRILLQVPPLFFMHVPKAGGHTTGSWLAQFYRGRSVELRARELAAHTREDLQRYAFYHSWHFGRGMLDLIGKPQIPVVTILREPVERDLSMLEHHRRVVQRFPNSQGAAYRSRVAAHLHASIYEWSLVNRDQRLIGNRQTHILGTTADYAPYLKGGSHAGPRSDWPTPPPFPELPLEPDAQLREAKAWLDRMPVVGINERFAESMTLITAAFGLPNARHYGHRNTNPQRTAHRQLRYRDQLNPEQLDEFVQMNRYDFELYGYARERFERDWSRFVADPKRTYSIAAYAARATGVLKYRARHMRAG